MNPYPARLLMPDSLWQAMLQHVLAHLPEEACGLIGGSFTGGSLNTPGGLTAAAAVLLPIENELHSPVRFRMSPAAQLEAMLNLEERGLEMLAIFHSHPAGPNHPSATDLGEFAYPGVLSLICTPEAAPTGPAWQARAYQIDGVFDPRTSYGEIPLVRIPDPL